MRRLRWTVVDARCGNNGDKITICHNGQTICVSVNAIPAHLAHGDVIGPCNSSSRNISAAVTQQTSELLVATSPNPNTDGRFSVHIQAGTEGHVQVNLFDMQGNLIEHLFDGNMQSGAQRDITVTHPELRQGLYLVRTQNGQDVKSVRVQVLP